MNAPVTPRERPILFSGEMVRQVLAGQMTQTRRPMKPQPSFSYPGTARLVYGVHPMSPSMFEGTPAEGLIGGKDRMGWLAEDWCGNVVGEAEADAFRCPYGEPGDRLWVREAWRAPVNLDDLSPQGIGAKAVDAGYREPWSPVQYEADGTRDNWDRSPGLWPQETGRYRHARFMPRWASRLLLDVVSVRVERVQDISASDAVAEGVVDPAHAWDGNVHYPRARFAEVWRGTYGDSWHRNDWVWVVEFRRVEASR